jgi:hypothetical protein
MMRGGDDGILNCRCSRSGAEGKWPYTGHQLVLTTL